MRGGSCECTHASAQGLSVCAQHAIVLPRINPKTHSETSVLKQVFCIHSGMGLRNAVGNRGLRVRPSPVCRLYTLMRPQFTGLCAHAVWVYAPAVYGLMRPYRTGLCARSLRAYAPMLYGSMSPQFMGLRARISGSYGFTLHGVVFAAEGGGYPITACCGGKAGCVTEPYISSGRYIRRRYRGPLPNQSGLAR